VVYDPSARGAQAYRALAEEILGRTGPRLPAVLPEQPNGQQRTDEPQGESSETSVQEVEEETWE
jgi:hypothetical protein